MNCVYFFYSTRLFVDQYVTATPITQLPFSWYPFLFWFLEFAANTKLQLTLYSDVLPSRLTLLF
eukprot:m.137659 g.137659  ORF g.137659 m.137659 type:complete len:64 (-) comp15899_c0_seq1:15-206(-)